MIQRAEKVRRLMRLNGCVFLIASSLCCFAWDTPPHRRITQAAVDTLPQQLREQLGAETASLVEIYCILPDRYTELKHYGFVRKSPGPRTLEEMRPYCVRPDGEDVHSATWDRDEDLGSLVYLFERAIRSLSEKRPADAARFLGTLAHFVEDSLSPPHAVGGDELGAPNLHGLLERSVPEFSLGGRSPRAAGQHIVPAAEAILARLYAGGDQNRRDLAAMAKAAQAGDEEALNTYRLRTGRTAAEILADALETVFEIAGSAPISQLGRR